MPRLGRPIVNRERDRLIFAYVDELVRSKGLSLRNAYAKTAESGRFGAMSARTVESAYLKERQRRRQRRRRAPGRIAAERNAQFLAAVAERAELNAHFLAAVRRHSLLFRHLRFIQAPPLNC